MLYNCIFQYIKRWNAAARFDFSMGTVNRDLIFLNWLFEPNKTINPAMSLNCKWQRAAFCGSKRLCLKADFWSFAILWPSKGCPVVTPWSLLLVVAVVTNHYPACNGLCNMLYLTSVLSFRNKFPLGAQMYKFIYIASKTSVWRDSFNYSLWFYQEGEKSNWFFRSEAFTWAKIWRFKIYFNLVMKCYRIFRPSKLHWKNRTRTVECKQQTKIKCKSPECNLSQYCNIET